MNIIESCDWCSCAMYIGRMSFESRDWCSFVNVHRIDVIRIARLVFAKVFFGNTLEYDRIA